MRVRIGCWKGVTFLRLLDANPSVYHDYALNILRKAIRQAKQIPLEDTLTTEVQKVVAGPGVSHPNGPVDRVYYTMRGGIAPRTIIIVRRKND